MNMRMYIYLDKDIIKCLAPKVSNISFDIDFFEYSEKRGYTTNNNTSLRPEIEKELKRDCKEEHFENKKRVCLSEDLGMLCNVEIVKRYINIEDVSSIKNNNFYYNIVEKIPNDNRVKLISGKIKILDKSKFYLDNAKVIINEEAYTKLTELFENACDIKCLGYKINCLNEEHDVYKPIAIYIE